MKVIPGVKTSKAVACCLFKSLFPFPSDAISSSSLSLVPLGLREDTETQLIPKGQPLSDPDPRRQDMDVLRRSSVFAAEVLDVFDRSLTDKELVSQSKALCRDYILSRINQNGLGWSKSELNLSPSNAALSEVSLVLLCLGERNLPYTQILLSLASEIAGQGLCFSFGL